MQKSKMEPKWEPKLQNGAKRDKNGAKGVQNGAKRVENGAQRVQNGAKGCQKGANGRPKCIQKSMSEKGRGKGAKRATASLRNGIIFGPKSIKNPSKNRCKNRYRKSHEIS